MIPLNEVKKYWWIQWNYNFIKYNIYMIISLIIIILNYFIWIIITCDRLELELNMCVRSITHYLSTIFPVSYFSLDIVVPNANRTIGWVTNDFAASDENSEFLTWSLNDEVHLWNFIVSVYMLFIVYVIANAIRYIVYSLFQIE